MAKLMAAAVAFTAQLAIDAAACNQDEARTLERDVLSKLETWFDKGDGTLKLRFMIYDVECVIEDLTCSVQPLMRHDLAIAAVAFTIQLAIDEAGRDATAMRSLERALISKLEGPWEFAAPIDPLLARQRARPRHQAQREDASLSADVKHGKPWESPAAAKP